MIRAQLINEIESALSVDPRFKANDFIVETGKTIEKVRDETVELAKLLIRYRYNNQYQLALTIPRQRTTKDYGGSSYRITGTMSPGGLGLSETLATENKDGIFQVLREWLQNLKSELDATPERRDLAQQRERLEELFSTVSDLPDEYFSKEEARSMEDKLNSLEERMKNSLAENVRSQEELEKKLRSLEADFEALRKGLDVLKKPSWAKAAMVRTFEWLKDPQNRKLLKSGAEVARDLLTDGIQAPPGS